MIKNLLSIIVLVILTSFVSSHIPAQERGHLNNDRFCNPIFKGDYPDPTIMRDGKDYYMTHSAFDYVPGLVIFHSIDLINWEPISYALSSYLGSIWAPDICKYKNKYYIYFTVSSPKHSNYVVCADSPFGPWSEPIDLKIGQIDPCHVVGENGQRWLFLSGGYRVKLSEDGLSVISGTLEHVYSGWKYPTDWITEGFALEGPKLKKIGDYFYYLSAEGGTAGPPTTHMIVVARSKSINGPWINDPHNPLVHTYNNSDKWWSRGHGSLIDTPEGQWWVVYHAYENQYINLGRQTLLEPIFITKEGWLKAPLGNRIERSIKKPIVSNRIIDRKKYLNQFRIGLDWKFYKQYDPNRASVNNGILTLKAQGMSPDESVPLMFVAGVHKYEVSVKIEITDSVTAGLILFYNASYYVGTGFNKLVRLRWRKGTIKSKNPQNGEKSIWLKIRNDNSIVTGYYSYDGINWMKEDWGMEISGYNHNTLYDFESILPGLFVYGKGYAQFSNLLYKEL